MAEILKIIPFSEFAGEFNPVVSSKKIVPDWYKNSRNRNSEAYLNEIGVSTATYKHCSPFLDALTLGYMVVLTADVEIRSTDNSLNVNTKSARTLITDHAPEQWDGLPPPKGYAKAILKWQQDIVLQTPNGYSCLFIQPMNRYDLPFLTISGVVDTDIYPIPTQFPFWVREDFNGVIEKGTPVCQILPFRRDEWKTKQEPFNEKKTYLGFELWRSKIVRSYKTQFWHKKRYDT